LEEGEELFWGLAEFFGEFGEFDEGFGELFALARGHAFVDIFRKRGEHDLFGGLHECQVFDFLAEDGAEHARADGAASGQTGEEDVEQQGEHGTKRRNAEKPKRRNMRAQRPDPPASAGGVRFSADQI
jgi:hypothetical protein